MRIVFVSHFFPPTRNAGTENYTLGLASALQARGHEVQVVCAEDWESGPAYWNGVTVDVHDGIVVNRVHLNWSKASNPDRVLYDSRRVETWFQDYLSTVKPDVVHVTSAATLGVGILRAVDSAGIRLVLTLMDFWFLCPKTVLLTGEGCVCDGRTTAWTCQQCLLTSSGLGNRLNGLMRESLQQRFWTLAGRSTLTARTRGVRGLALDMNERKTLVADILNAPDTILSHSKFVQHMFAQAGVDQPIRHLQNGHDLDWLDRYHGKTPSSVLRIGYMGQINAMKGVHVLVEAFQKAGLDGRARLDIWGDTAHSLDYTRLLQSLIADDEHINLCGRFDRARLDEVLATIDVLVVPSLWYENAPLVIYESFAAETPVIATDLGGMAEAVTHEVDGLLFERGNSTELASLLQRVAAEPGLIERLRRGIQPVRTVDDEVCDLEALYLSLIPDAHEGLLASVY